MKSSSRRSPSYLKKIKMVRLSLDDFENAICYKDNNVVLIVESYSALLRLLLRGISLVTWTDYMCDFLEVAGNEELSTHITTIKRGHYSILDIHAKLAIFAQLVNEVLACNVMREKLDEYIEERKALAVEKRGEALEQGRISRKIKEMAKVSSNGV
ncbi:putative transcription factor & chromatin remodeling DDT family [Helianthus debilis subsp. tardiflorus]